MLSRWSVSLIFAINGFIYANWVARIPLLQEQYGLDHGDLGIVLLSTSLGALVGMPITGRIIVTTGSRQLTTILLFCYCIVHALIPWMVSFYPLLLLFFMIGVCAGSLDVSMNAQAVLVEQKAAKPIMSSFHAIFSAGMMIGAFSGAAFARFQIGMGPHLFIISGLSVLGAIWAIQHLIADRREEANTDEPSKTPFRLRPELIVLGLIAFCCMLGEGAMADWSTNYLEKVSGASRYWAPIGLGAFSTAMMIGRLLGDAARLRFGDARLLLLGSCLAAAGMTLALLLPNPLFSTLGFFFVGAGLATIVPIAYSTAGTVPGLSPGLGISMVSTIGYAGFLVGPPVIGFLGDAFGLRIGMSFVLLLFAVMLVLNLAGQRYLAANTVEATEMPS